MPSRGRPTKPLPVTVLDHVVFCIEEQLLQQAFSLLSSSLTANAGSNAPALLPPAQHIALAATVAVHPQLTTRTDSHEKHAAADEALRYLRHVVKTLGPRDPSLAEAFHFRGAQGRLERSKRAKSRKSILNDDSDDEQDKAGYARSSYTSKQSLWSNAEDFWGVVGWAFNCSVLHKARWERWKQWLEIMLDVLQAELDVVAAQDGCSDFRNTLIARYLAAVGSGRSNKRGLMRAVLADGSSKSLAEFGEIWRDETKPTKKKQDERTAKKRKLDVENGEFGDYFDDDSEEGSPAVAGASNTGSRRPGRARRSKIKAEEPPYRDDNISTSGGITTVQDLESLGGSDSVRLRQKFIALLTQVSRAAPTSFMDTEELFSLYTEFLRPLPLPAFQQFVSPLKAYMHPDLHISVNEMIFQLISGAAPYGSADGINQRAFEEEFAPVSAISKTVLDNAKLSLLVESMLRGLWRAELLSPGTKNLIERVEQGIAARDAKVMYDVRRKSAGKGESHDEAKLVLRTSAERMRVLVHG